MFGTQVETSQYEEFEFDDDLLQIDLCIDFYHVNSECHDFQSCIIYTSSGQTITLGPECDGDFVQFDLSRNTLIGFRTVISDAFIRTKRNIRTICPIVQEIEVVCCETTIQIDAIENMLKDTGSGSHTQEIVAKNLLSNGAELTECGQLTYTLENAPSYLSLSGTTLTVTSDSLSDPEDTTVVTLKVSLDGNPCVEESVFFTVSLACPTDTICDFSGAFNPVSLPEVSCDAGDPQTLAGFTGTVGDNPAIDNWYIEYGNYMLTKI